MNTSSVNGAQGFLDFQFNPGNSSAQIAIAQISQFQADGGVLVFNVTSPQIAGDVSGTLAGTPPGTVTFTNDTVFNDYFQQFTYGSFFSFRLALDGPALTNPNGVATAGSTFFVGLFDQNQNAILTNQASGFAGAVQVNLDGSTTAQAFPSDNMGGASVVGFQAVPEPGTWLLLGFGSLLLLLWRRARQPSRFA